MHCTSLRSTGKDTIIAGSTTFPLNDRSEDCIQSLAPEFEGAVGVELKRCIREIHTTAGQQGQIVSGSTTFPLNEEVENCANRVQQGNPRKPGLAVSKCLRTPLSTPAPDEPYFDPAGCSEIKRSPQQGQTVSLGCKVNQLGTNQITWLKTIKGHPTNNNKLNIIVISFAEHIALKDDRFGWAGNLNNTFDLEIENINSGDDGVYRCQIAGTQKSWNITLKVQVPPSIREIQLVPGSDGIIEERLTRKYVYNETDTMQIRCIPDGFPLPPVIWRKATERTPFRLGPNLTVTNANRTDSGVYICQVQYKEDSMWDKKDTEKRIEIVVQYKPEVVPRRTDIRESAGKYVQLECSVRSNPPARYVWLKDNITVPEILSQVDKPKSTRIPLLCNEDKTRLIILSLDPENDYGNYTCVATNSLGAAMGYIEVSGRPLKPSIKSKYLSNKKHSYRLIWTSGQNGDPSEDASYIPITQYVIQYQGWWYEKKDGKISTQFSHKSPLTETYDPLDLLPNSGRRHSFRLMDLRDNITYQVFLYGRNQYGDGEKVEFQFKTNSKDLDDPTVSPAPTEAIFGNQNAESMKVWSADDNRSGSSRVTSALSIIPSIYIITYFTSNGHIKVVCFCMEF
ncbi:MAM domain-containing glycosylphosphatidylinositol anchor protein 1-like [Amphiura filiformis]|uniref:MAM domain-containing glycosylphosphatidylinositol anchor protein 1-like n=1 Tax=Amphiura filiformis TaxID=82378 RepID=UPI003B21A4BE